MSKLVHNFPLIFSGYQETYFGFCGNSDLIPSEELPPTQSLAQTKSVVVSHETTLANTLSANTTSTTDTNNATTSTMRAPTTTIASITPSNTTLSTSASTKKCKTNTTPTSTTAATITSTIASSTSTTSTFTTKKNLITLTQCCDRLRSWETTVPKQPPTIAFHRDLDPIKPSTQAYTTVKVEEQTEMLITKPTMTKTTEKITPPLSTKIITASITTNEKITTTERTKERSSTSTLWTMLTNTCCDRPKTWETRSSIIDFIISQVMLNSIRSIITSSTTSSTTTTTASSITATPITITTTTKTTPTTTKTTNNTTTTTSNPSITENNTTNTSNATYSNVCCDRPQTWETTTFTTKMYTFSASTERTIIAERNTTTSARLSSTVTTTPLSSTITRKTSTPTTTPTITPTTIPTSSIPISNLISASTPIFTRINTEPKKKVLFYTEKLKTKDVVNIVENEIIPYTERLTEATTEEYGTRSWHYPPACEFRKCQRPSTWLTTVGRSARKKYNEMLYSFNK